MSNEAGHENCYVAGRNDTLDIIGLFDCHHSCQHTLPFLSRQSRIIKYTVYMFISGLCLDQLGGTCLPKRQPKTISHQVVFYSVNGTQVYYREDETLL